MNDLLSRQYEAFPYPTRDPKDEAKRLIVGSPSDLDEVSHYLYGGRLDPKRPFRALVAGGGTGDGLIMLAQQLADRAMPAEIVYLDLSNASLKVAEARARARGLTSIRFLQGSLFDLANLAPGPYDYIDCCGVLHHLPEPAAGLAALARQLAPDGGMGLMLYGPLGRTGVYPLQAFLHQAVGDRPLSEQVVYARKLLAQMPQTNWLKRNPYLGDHMASDAALVDLLLHSQDRALTVAEIVALVAVAGLTLVSFIEPWRYEPAAYLSDPLLLRPFATMPQDKRWAAAEQLAGNMKTHVFYVTRRSEPAKPEPQDDLVPVLKKVAPKDLAKSLAASGRIKLENLGSSLQRALPRLAPAIVERIDGKTSIGEIRAALPVDRATFDKAFAESFEALSSLNILLLRQA